MQVLGIHTDSLRWLVTEMAVENPEGAPGAEEPVERPGGAVPAYFSRIVCTPCQSAGGGVRRYSVVSYLRSKFR